MLQRGLFWGGAVASSAAAAQFWVEHSAQDAWVVALTFQSAVV